jgi:hypothetical protein
VLHIDKHLILWKLEEILKSTVPMDKQKSYLKHYLHPKCHRKLNDVLKPYEISGEQYNVLRIRRGQRQSRMCTYKNEC